MFSRALRKRAGRAMLAAGLLGAVAVPATGAHASGTPAERALAHGAAQVNSPVEATSTVPPKARLRALTAALPYRDQPRANAIVRAAGVSTIPTWSSTVVAGQSGAVYPFTMVGKPVSTPAKNAHIKTIVIPVSITFSASGHVYDPTVANGACGETQSDLTAALNGPIFKKVHYSLGGTAVGKTQYIDALQREEFWSYTNPAGVNPTYHVFLNGNAGPKLNVTVNGGVEYGGGTCGAVGTFDLGTWDSLVQNTLFPSLASSGVSPKTFPIFLFKNVVLYFGSPGNCCYLGYHSAFNNPSFGGASQTYGVSEYDTNGAFSGVADQSVLSHEVGEWMDDPYINNPTPAWGHIGQVSGCQGNLEVGDPLSGTIFPVTVKGQTYHVQELAFYGWFFDHAGGINGLYSTNGTFATGATLCH